MLSSLTAPQLTNLDENQTCFGQWGRYFGFTRLDLLLCIGLNEQFSWKTQQEPGNYCSCFTHRGSCVHTPLCHIINLFPHPYFQLYFFSILQLHLSPSYLQFPEQTKCAHMSCFCWTLIYLVPKRPPRRSEPSPHFIRNGFRSKERFQMKQMNQISRLS